MPLEAGDFIPELNANNPLGSDPKSEGDDHMRLIKRCTLGSFPGFVGNAGTPKSVSLTEDQINDLAQKSAAQTISGAWFYEADILLANDVAINADTTTPVVKAMLKMTSGSIRQFGDDDNITSAYRANQHEFYRPDAALTVRRVASTTTPEAGSWLIRDIALQDKKTGFRNPTRITRGAGTHSADQSWEGQTIDFTSATPDLNLPVLETGTSFLLVFSSGAGQKRILENGTNILWFDGATSGSPPSGTRLINGPSVVQVYYANTVTPYIWGNGIS